MSVSVVAFLALILFVPLAVTLYATVRPTLATVLVLLVAILLLPEHVGFDPPGLPPFDKSSIAGLCAYVGCLVTAGRKLRAARPGRGIDLFGVVLIAGIFVTALSNRDTLSYGDTVLPSLSVHDGFSDAVRMFLYAIIPFFLGRVLFRSVRDIEDLMGAFVLGALAYIPFILIELRMSPQLHRWVYGFHQHDFGQTVREGGYRPMVFMPHGIALAMFVLAAAMSAFALSRARLKLPFGIPATGLGLLLFLLLLACKSVGAAIYGFACIPLLIAASPRTMARVARWLAVFVLAYPVLRITGTFPVESVVNVAARLNRDRAESLAFRFGNEDQLVAKALQRGWFGWGGFGRARVYNDWGKDDSVTDGHWIIILGNFGFVGMVAMYGMLLTPCLLTARRLRRIHDARERLIVGSMSLVTVVAIVDLLPNGLYTGIPLLLAGSLDGASKGVSRSQARGRGG